MTITETTPEVAAPASTSPNGTGAAPTSSGPGAGRNRRPGLNTETLALGAIFIAMFSFAAAIFAVGLASRALDERDAAVAAGGNGSGGGGVAAAVVDVSLSEFMIMPDPMTVPAGATLHVVNDGTVEHNLSVEGLATPNIPAGESADLDIASLAPGTYTVICAIVGHKEAGMETTLTIG